MQHELVSSFYFNSKAIHHLFVTRKKTNKMHHCEIYFQNLCHAHKTVVFKMSKLPKVQVWTIWIKIVQISFLSNLIKFEQVWTSLIKFEQVRSSLNKLDQVWTSLNKFDPVWTFSNKFDRFGSNLNQFDPIWSSLN